MPSGYVLFVSEDHDWTVDIDTKTGVRSEFVQLAVLPDEYAGGTNVLGGEGWVIRQVDRAEHNEWVLVTDSGTVFDFLSEADAVGLPRVAVRRFDTPEARATWLEGREGVRL